MENFKEKVSEGVHLVDFWATWCSPCKTLTPVISELKEKYDGKAGIHKVNVDENSELTKELFSKLIKGSHKDRKFLFNLKESYLLEVNPKSFNESYTESVTGKSQKKYIRLV